MLSQSPLAIVILAVDINSQRTTQRRIHGPRHYRRPISVLETVSPQVLNRDTGLTVNHTRLAIPTQNPIHTLNVNNNRFSSRIGIPVTPARASQSNRSSLFLGECKNVSNFLNTSGSKDKSCGSVGLSKPINRL